MIKKRGSVAFQTAMSVAIAVALAAATDFTTTTGTIKTVDLAAHEVTVITGPGYALRAVIFHVDADKKDLPALSTLKPGTVVQVWHHKVAGREEAVNMAVVSPETERRQP